MAPTYGATENGKRNPEADLRANRHVSGHIPECECQDIPEELLPPTEIRNHCQLACWCCGSTHHFRKHYLYEHDEVEDDRRWVRDDTVGK